MILIFNIGSSTIKYSVFNLKLELIENKVVSKLHSLNDIKKNVSIILKEIISKYDLIAIGHRVVHGKNISDVSRVDDKLIKELESISHLAPLHNIPQTYVIKFCANYFKKNKIKQFVVFDTAFHSTIKGPAKIYGLSKKLTEAGYVRYGFHGISHEYVSTISRDYYKLKYKKNASKIITCHLGAGSSVCAILNGKSIDTSMGYTPLEGPIMASRVGSIDPGIIIELMNKFGKNKTVEILNKKSGIFGISNKFNSVKEVFNSNDSDSILAFEKYCFDISKIISSYLVSLNGLDLIVFTGGIGENNSKVRQKIIDNLSFLDIKIKDVNYFSEFLDVSNSKIKVFITHTNEELMIAKKIIKLL